MHINEISREIHANAIEKGFWDKERNTGELLMLVVSEISEALEADRMDVHCRLSIWAKDEMDLPGNANDHTVFRMHVKDTFEDEIADAVIRLFDIAAGKGFDLEWHIKAKLRYNKSRPHKHGKAY